MDWFYGNDDEDFIVPRDEEVFDRLPSPDSWPSWVNKVGNPNSQKILNEKILNVLGMEELISSDPTFHRHAFRQQSARAYDHSDAQLNDLPRIEEADDIFFDSLFKVGTGEFDRFDSSAITTQTWGSNDEMEVDFSNHIRDSMNDSSNIGRFPPQKELEAELCMLEERSDLTEDINEYMSMDEPVLLELLGLTHQLADTTRLCFRDSLYRLAENSRCQTKCSQNEKEDLKNDKPISRIGASRLQESRTKESEAKAIDRTVASLLFTTAKSCNSTPTPTPTAISTSCLDVETLQREDRANSLAYHSGSSNTSFCIVEGGDAEVPTFDSTNQPFPPLSRPFFSTAPVKGS